MRVAKTDVDVQMEIPGAVLRQRKNFGDATGFGKISGEYFSLASGVDTRPLFVGLDGGVCDCPHWGFVLRGRITTTNARGEKETVNKDDLFYWPPGHNVQVEEDADIVMFSPEQPHTAVIDHMIRKVSEPQA
ncbi:MAG TPA: cupin domain-containing protein [Thermoanaerobaculia bacterium]|nr:cupin domain-containing protein [Thermoanaerobaculia bacterium]